MLSNNAPYDVFKHFWHHIPQPSHRNVCDFIFFSPFLFGGTICGWTLRDLLSICLASGQNKTIRKECQHVWHFHLFVGRGNWLEGKVEIQAKERGERTVQIVYYYWRNRVKMQSSQWRLSVTVCGLTANLAFNICLRFKFPGFTHFYDCSDTGSFLIFSSRELHIANTHLYITS